MLARPLHYPKNKRVIEKAKTLFAYRDYLGLVAYICHAMVYDATSYALLKTLYRVKEMIAMRKAPKIYLCGTISTTMDKKDFLSQVFLELIKAIIALVVAGGATGILTQFKERLPSSFYTIFLYVIWGVIIIMLAWIALSVVFGDSPKKLMQWIKNRVNRKDISRKLKTWCDKYLELADLVSDVAKTDWQITDVQKESYRYLHIWFELKRSDILPFWQRFYHNRTNPANMDTLSRGDLEWVTLDEHWRDPFSVFYEPMTLNLLQSILKRWNKNEIIYVLRKLKELNLEFTAWTLLRYE